MKMVDIVPLNLTVEQYIQTVNLDSRHRVIFFFQHLKNFLQFIKESRLSDEPIPHIRISEDKREFARGVSGVVFISAGLIELCLSAGWCFKESILDFPVPSEEFDSDQIGMTAVRWVLAHEYYHSIQKHSDVELLVGKDVLTSHALEMDADMMAMSSIYRTYQIRYENIISNDLHLRQLTIYCLFWVLRTLPDDVTEGHHPSLATRLHMLASKLGNLRASYTDVADPFGSTQETILAKAAVFKCMFKCEEEFMKYYPGSDKQDMYTEWCRLENDGTINEILARWKELAPVVESLCMKARLKE